MGKHDDAVRLGQLAPVLTDGDVFEINKAFPSYLFRRRKTGEVWTSCCMRHEYLPKKGRTPAQEALMAAEHKAEPRGYCHAAYAMPGKAFTVKCPWCGKVGAVKELGRCGRRDNLSAWRRAVVLKWHGGALWGIACYTAKHYGGSDFQLINRPDVTVTSVYRFSPGQAEKAACRTYQRKAPEWHSYARFELAHLKSRGGFSEPFGWSGDMGRSYDMVNMSALKQSPFRWCQAKEFDAHSSDMMRFFAVCTVYPKQVELLMKAGMWSVVKDLVEDGVTNRLAIDWTQTDPRKAFGLETGEIREFLACGHELPVLVAYKRAKKKGVPSPMAAWKDLYRELWAANLFLEIAAKLYNNGLTVEKWRRYIERERETTKKASSVSFGTVAIWWKDYINAAKLLGYNLKNPVFLLPRDLSKKHDEAVHAAQPILDARRDKKNGEKEAKRLRSLTQRYTYSDGRWLIRPPRGASEIVAEGKALKHCVGGYADRHVNGTTTILFLRDRQKPGKPLVTIEMSGNRIVQIHGWDDERTACKANPKRESPRTLYADFLGPWLAWLEGGSKRGKDGRPKVPKKHEARKTGAA